MSGIVRSNLAKSDLIEIWLYVAKESVVSADRALDRIEQVLDRIAKFPLSGRERPEIAPEVRSEVAGRYLLIYQFSRDRVHLLRVIDGSRDLRDLLDL